MQARVAIAVLLGAAGGIGAAVTAGQPRVAYVSNLPIDDPRLDYWGYSDDRIARLAERFASGKARFEKDPAAESDVHLRSLLNLLDVSVDSQVLVFSKTSLQEALVSPRNPRAIYFSDDVAVGYVPGSDLIELAAVSPGRGVVFYTLDARAPDAPRFTRPRGCLRCHRGPATLGVPGVFVGSVLTSGTGRPDFRGSLVTDHRTPFEARWRGWYVSGTHGEQRHGGNAVRSGPADLVTLEPGRTQNLTSLARKFDDSRYPSAVSDIVALMTLEHQTQMTNLLTRLHWESKLANGDPVLAERVGARIDEVVDYMIFADEDRFASPIVGVSSFSESFPSRGPRDEKGRSLRDFDLETRLFRHPLSYMVYSEAFDALPESIRDRVYSRLLEALDVRSTADSAPPAKLSTRRRRAAIEILCDTKSGLPAAWLQACGRDP